MRRYSSRFQGWQSSRYISNIVEFVLSGGLRKVVMSISKVNAWERLSFSRKASPFFPSKLKMERGQSEAAAQGDFLGFLSWFLEEALLVNSSSDIVQELIDSQTVLESSCQRLDSMLHVIFEN